MSVCQTLQEKPFVAWISALENTFMGYIENALIDIHLVPISFNIAGNTDSVQIPIGANRSQQCKSA